MRERNRTILFITGSLALVLMLTVLLLPLAEYLELKTYDFRVSLREPRKPSAPIVLVAIDDASFASLHKRWPWPRTWIAGAVQRIVDDGAKVVALDIILSDEGFSDEEDRALEEALGSGAAVVLADKISVSETSSFSMMKFESPLERYLRSNVRTGFVNLRPDTDGTIRSVPIAADSGSGTRPSFPAAIAQAYRADSLLRAGVSGSVLVDYIDRPPCFRTVSFSDALRGEFTPGTFSGAIVVIGAAFPESHDRFPTPLTPADGMYGYEIFAYGVNTILNGNGTVRFPYPAVLCAALLIMVVSAYFSFSLNPWKTLLFLGISAALFSIITLFLFNSGIWLDYTLFLLVPFLTSVTGILFRYFREAAQRRKVQELFSRYMSPVVVRRILERKEPVELGGENKKVTILFSDIRNFTGTSEKLAPAEVVEMLNTYFHEMAEVIFEHEGIINKYIGDAIMALFGTPVDQPDASERAVRTALDMRNRLAALNGRQSMSAGFPIRIGIGIHTGYVVAGNIGSHRQMEYTVIGDTVNVCSRIESLTKELHTDILISDEVFREVENLFTVTTPRPMDVKGKSEPVRVHIVKGLREELSGKEINV